MLLLLSSKRHLRVTERLQSTLKRIREENDRGPSLLVLSSHLCQRRQEQGEDMAVKGWGRYQGTVGPKLRITLANVFSSSFSSHR